MNDSIVVDFPNNTSIHGICTLNNGYRYKLSNVKLEFYLNSCCWFNAGHYDFPYVVGASTFKYSRERLRADNTLVQCNNTASGTVKFFSQYSSVYIRTVNFITNCNRTNTSTANLVNYNRTFSGTASFVKFFGTIWSSKPDKLVDRHPFLST